MRIRNHEFRDGCFYFLELNIKKERLVTIGKFVESELSFHYFNYLTEEIEVASIFEIRKIAGVYSVDTTIKDLDYRKYINMEDR